MSACRFRLHLGGTVLHRFAECEKRIASQEGRAENDMLHMHAVVTDETMSEVIKGQAELRTAINRFIGPGFRIKAKVLACQRNRLLIRLL